MKNQTDSPQAQPNRWHTEQLWRQPFPKDKQRAEEVRRMLVELGWYPGYDLAQNANLAIWEANCRAALPAMIAELDRTDVIAVTDIVRFLALAPRQADFWRQCGRPDD